MATITTEADRIRNPAGDQRVVLRGVDWETYQELAKTRDEESQHVLMAYNRGVLEIMSPGPLHEIYKTRLGMIVRAVTLALKVPRLSLASTTWDRPEAERGLEADECYILTDAKLQAINRAAITNNARDLPAPDLAIEIDMNTSEVDRPEIYATLGVREVWRFDGESLRINRLRDDGRYETVFESLFLPIAPDEIAAWLSHEDFMNENVWEERLHDWARGVVAPRRRPTGHGPEEVRE